MKAQKSIRLVAVGDGVVNRFQKEFIATSQGPSDVGQKLKTESEQLREKPNADLVKP